MTKKNYAKREIRERMALTGEAYSQAKREIERMPLATWPELDLLLGGGLRRGSLHILAAKSSLEAATVARRLLKSFSEKKVQAAYASIVPLETPQRRELSALPGVTTWENLGSLNELYRKLTPVFHSKVLFLDNLPSLSFGPLSSQQEEQARAARMLKQWAAEHNVAVVLLTTETAKRSPSTLFSLPGASELYATADVVLSLRGATVTLDLFHLLKNRWGKTGEVAVRR